MLLSWRKGRKEELKVPWSSVILAFQIYKFSYFIRFICNSRSNPCRAVLVIPEHARAQKSEMFDFPSACIPSWGWARQCWDLLPSSGCSGSCFCVLFFFKLVMSLFKIAACMTKVVSKVPEGKKATMCFRQRTSVRYVSFRLELRCCWLWVQC